MFRIALTQVQHLALGLLEPHQVHVGPLLKLVQVPLDGISFFCCINRTTQLSVVCKLAEGALDPTVYVIDKDIKQYWSQDRPLRDTIHHWPLPGHGAIGHHSLGVTFKPISCPLNGPPIKSISIQFGDQDVMLGHVKSLADVQVDDIGRSSLVN